LAVKHAELLAQDSAGDQQWLDALKLRCRGYTARGLEPGFWGFEGCMC
jgi:hypothetical protein